MELYISDHPLDCLTCAANGDCAELQEGWPRRRRPARRPLRLRGSQPPGRGNPTRAIRTSPSTAPSASSVRGACVPAKRPRGMFALTIAGRGFGSKVVPGSYQFPRIGVRLLWCVRAGLPDRDAGGEVGHHPRRAAPHGAHNLRLLRGRVLVQGRAARRRSGPHGALQGRWGKRGPFVCEGPFCLGVRHSQRAPAHPDGPRCHRRPVARGEPGKRPSPTPPTA